MSYRRVPSCPVPIEPQGSVEHFRLDVSYFRTRDRESERGHSEERRLRPYAYTQIPVAVVRDSHDTIGQAAAGIDGSAGSAGRFKLEWEAEIPDDGGEPRLVLHGVLSGNSGAVLIVDFRPACHPAGIAVMARDLRVQLETHRWLLGAEIVTRISLEELPPDGLRDVAEHLLVDDAFQFGYEPEVPWSAEEPNA